MGNRFISAALAAVFLIASFSGSLAQSAQTYVLTAGLVEEIFQKLARQPYAEVAPLIIKLQAEVQHQPAPPPTDRTK